MLNSNSDFDDDEDDIDDMYDNYGDDEEDSLTFEEFEKGILSESY